MVRVNAAKRTHVNFSKANWANFREYLEIEIGRLLEPQYIHVGEKHFRKKITDASKSYIPAGYIPEDRPNFPTETVKLSDERDALCVTNSDDPRIKTISTNIKNVVRDHMRTKWRTYLEKCEFGSGANNLWRTIKSLTNRKTQGSNYHI